MVLSEEKYFLHRKVFLLQYVFQLVFLLQAVLEGGLLRSRIPLHKSVSHPAMSGGQQTSISNDQCDEGHLQDRLLQEMLQAALHPFLQSCTATLPTSKRLADTICLSVMNAGCHMAVAVQKGWHSQADCWICNPTWKLTVQQLQFSGDRSYLSGLSSLWWHSLPIWGYGCAAIWAVVGWLSVTLQDVCVKG